METILIMVAASTFIVGTVSFIHQLRQRAFLTNSLKVEEQYNKDTFKEFGMDGAAVVGISVFDVLYNTMKLDPNAIKGINHLHHNQSFESLGDLMKYMKENIIRSEPGDNSWRMMIHKYKGYTGEESAFNKLSENGHNLDIPHSGTAEGLDVRIDGKDYNVKITDNPRYIQDHLDKHPDIDVVTNREMAQAFGNHPRVIIDPDLSSQEAFHSTAETFEGMSDLGDLIDGVPYITLAINAAKNGRKIYNGDIDLMTATEHTVLDTATVGVGGMLGAKAGLAVGVALAPVTGGTSAIIIPVATSLVGTLIGIFSGKGISGWVKERHLRSAVNQLKTLAIEFREKFLNLYEEVVTVVDSFFLARIKSAAVGMNEEGFLKRTLFPKLSTTFYKMASNSLRIERADRRRYYSDLFNKVQESSPSEGGLILFAQGVGILNEVDPLPDFHAAIEEQFKRIEIEKRKLK